MSIRFRNKDGKVSDVRSIPDQYGAVRDDVILDADGVREVLATYFQQQYGHKTPPKVTVTLFNEGGEMTVENVEQLVEIEFTEVEDPIPF